MIGSRSDSVALAALRVGSAFDFPLEGGGVSSMELSLLTSGFRVVAFFVAAGGGASVAGVVALTARALVVLVVVGAGIAVAFARVDALVAAVGFPDMMRVQTYEQLCSLNQEMTRGKHAPRSHDGVCCVARDAI